MSDNLNTDGGSWLFDHNDNHLRFGDTSLFGKDYFDEIMPEFKGQEIFVRLVFIISSSPELKPDYFWAFLTKNPEDGELCYTDYFLPVFKMDNWEEFKSLPFQKVYPIPIGNIFLREGLPYSYNLADNNILIIARIRFLLHASIIKMLFPPPDMSHSVEYYPVKAFNLYDGKYLGVFWCIQKNDGECINFPVDSKFNEHYGCMDLCTYEIHKGECVLIGNPFLGYYHFQADSDEDGMCVFTKLDKPVTDENLKAANALLPGEKLKRPEVFPIDVLKIPTLSDKPNQNGEQPVRTIEICLN